MQMRRVTLLDDYQGRDISGNTVDMAKDTIHLISEVDVQWYLARPQWFEVSETKVDIVTYAINETTGVVIGFVLPDGAVQPFGSGSGSTVIDIDDLTDVALNNPLDGQVLKFVGGVWTNAYESGGSGGGTAGRGIESFLKIGTVGNVDTYRQLYTDGSQVLINIVNGTNGIQGLTGNNGTNGLNGTNGVNGWSPVAASVVDGERVVLKIVDWVGGSGTKPAINLYISSTGLTATLASATDFRGAQGAGGAGSGSSIPTAIAAAQVFTIAANTQVLFAEPIDFAAGAFVDFGANSFLTQVN